MPVLRRVPVVLRRFLARHPLFYWTVAALAVAMLVGSVAERSSRIDDARDRWGDTQRVWVATHDHDAGDRIDAEPVEWPTAMVAETAAAQVDGAVARQRISAGEVVDRNDLAAPGPLGLIPDGWVALALAESPRVGARVGDRVQLASDGIILAREAIVVDVDDERTVVAVDAGDAGPIASAAADRSISMLLVP